jgi:hypothetical protein
MFTAQNRPCLLVKPPSVLVKVTMFTVQIVILSGQTSSFVGNHQFPVEIYLFGENRVTFATKTFARRP